MLNQYINSHGTSAIPDTRETIGGVEEAKDSMNIHIANVEKGILSMVTGMIYFSCVFCMVGVPECQ